VDKLCEYDAAEFGISGLETALGALMTLVHRGEVDMSLMVHKLTTGPASVIGQKLGTLEEGAIADVTLFDPDEEWTVEPSTLASKGKNTPLAGMRLRGRVVCTISAGKPVYVADGRRRPSSELESQGAASAQ
jgi:dihydroorotase